jgi:uncharacterized OB-fold protein
VLELEQLVCDRCASRVQEWQTVEPRGTVHAVTVVHRLQAGLVRTDQPYPLVDVELASGHRVLMTTVARADRPPAIGDPVSVTFRTIGTVAVPALAVDRPPQSSAAGTAATDTEVSP